MNLIPISKLYGYNFSVEALHILKQFWSDIHIYSCLDSPKNANLFMYLDGCDAEYTDESGESILAKSKSLVYIPDGFGYKIKVIPKGSSSTVGIKFSLFDEKGEKFILSDKITVFSDKDFGFLVEKINIASKGNIISYAMIKSALFEIFAHLSENREYDKKYRIIEKGIRYLETETDGDMPISEIAKMCNVSEIYFRRLFKEYSGFSPACYRLKSRVEKATRYLLYEDLSVKEIADISGFKDTSYFCRQFKKYTGISPMQYKKEMC